MDVDYEEEDDDDDDEDMADVLDESGDGVINVRNLSLDYFRSSWWSILILSFNVVKSIGPKVEGQNHVVYTKSK